MRRPRLRFTLRRMMVAVAMLGIAAAYVRFVIWFTWLHAQPNIPTETTMTAALDARLEVIARQMRSAMFIKFAIFPIALTLLIGLSVLPVRFLDKFISTDFTTEEQ